MEAENEVEGELVCGDGHGEKRLEASTNEEDGWTPAEDDDPDAFVAQEERRLVLETG